MEVPWDLVETELVYRQLLLLKLRFLTQYILFTNFSKLLKLRFLTHHILFTYFSKLLKLNFLMQYIHHCK